MAEGLKQLLFSLLLDRKLVHTNNMFQEANIFTHYEYVKHTI